MSTESERQAYRKRLNQGDVVYFVEGESELGRGELTVKKGNLRDAGQDYHYPYVLIWPNPNQDPNGIGIVVSKSPRALFTSEEVTQIVCGAEGPLVGDTRNVDELIVDPLAKKELTIVLGQNALSRLIDDELRRPGDPEY